MCILQKVAEALETHASQGWWSLICIPGSHEQQEIKPKIDQNSLCVNFFPAFFGRWTQMLVSVRDSFLSEIEIASPLKLNATAKEINFDLG